MAVKYATFAGKQINIGNTILSMKFQLILFVSLTTGGNDGIIELLYPIDHIFCLKVLRVSYCCV
jgi:hypothetical protein